MAQWTASEKRLMAVCKTTLDEIIEAWSAATDAEEVMTIDGAVVMRMKNRMMVDKAVREMWLKLICRTDDVFGDVKNLDRVEKGAYHLAVNAYFRIYRGRKRGRPQTDPFVLRQMVDMKSAGNTIPEIALAFGLDPAQTKSRDLVRKRIKKASSEQRKQ
jgi:hypothetical protein